MFNICSPRRNIIFALSPGYLRSSLSPQTPAGSGSSPLASIAHPLPGLCVSSWFIYYPWEGLLTRHNNNPAAEKRGEILCRHLGHLLNTWGNLIYIYSMLLHLKFLNTLTQILSKLNEMYDVGSGIPVQSPLFGLNWDWGALWLGLDNNAFLSHQIAMWHRGTPRCV